MLGALAAGYLWNEMNKDSSGNSDELGELGNIGINYYSSANSRGPSGGVERSVGAGSANMVEGRGPGTIGPGRKGPASMSVLDVNKAGPGGVPSASYGTSGPRLSGGMGNPGGVQGGIESGPEITSSGPRYPRWKPMVDPTNSGQGLPPVRSLPYEFNAPRRGVVGGRPADMLPQFPSRQPGTYANEPHAPGEAPAPPRPETRPKAVPIPEMTRPSWLQPNPRFGFGVFGARPGSAYAGPGAGYYFPR